MTSDLAFLKPTKTILLTTYKRDGSPVATPVSVAFEGDRAFFRSYDKAWKSKRLRDDPRVAIAPATLRGRPTGPTVPARATLLTDDQARIAARALARRHRLLQGVLVPLLHRSIARCTTSCTSQARPARRAGLEKPHPDLADRRPGGAVEAGGIEPPTRRCKRRVFPLAPRPRCQFQVRRHADVRP